MNGLKSGSWRSYHTGRNAYLAFSAFAGYPDGEYAPIDVDHLIAFSSWLFFHRRVSWSSVKGYLASVRAFAIVHGKLDFPPSPFRALRVVYCLRAIRTLSPKSERVRLPITIWILRKIIDFLLDRDAPGDLLLATLCSLLFFGLFRIGEILAKPPLEDGISWDKFSIQDDVIIVHLLGSKADVFRDGVDVRVVCTGDKYCPKRLLTLLLLRQRPSSTDQPVFLWRGRQMSAGVFNKVLKSIISDLGMRPSKYASHSFRKGMATTLAILNVPASFIKVIGRWKSIAYQSYISVPNSQLVDTIRRVGSVTDSSSFVGGGSADPSHIFGPSDLFDIDALSDRVITRRRLSSGRS